MAQPSTRKELIEYCKRKLGAPVLEINVADEQIDDLLDDAVQFFQERHFDGVYQTFYKYQVTQEDINRGRAGYSANSPSSAGIALTSAVSNIVGTATTFTYYENSNYLQVPPNIIGVNKIFSFDGANTITHNMFSVKYQLFLNDIYYWGTTELLSYAMVKTYLEDLDFLLNTQKQIRFNKRQDRLYLDIDWGSGWDEGDEESASDAVIKMLEGVAKGSTLFEDYDHYCMDILQTLVIIPMEKQNYDSIHKSYLSMIKGFIKIENQISSPFYNLYILKGVTDAARCVRALYADKNTRIDAIRTFRHQVQEKVAEVAGFCRLDKVHFEKLLCSLLVFSRCVEGVLYDNMKTRMAEKEREYKKLPLQSVEQIYASIEANLPDDYVYNENTSVFIINTHKEECAMWNVPKEIIETVNELHPMSRGTYIYDVYNSERNFV